MIIKQVLSFHWKRPVWAVCEILFVSNSSFKENKWNTKHIKVFFLESAFIYSDSDYMNYNQYIYQF